MAKRSNVQEYSNYTIEEAVEEPVYEEKPAIVIQAGTSYNLVRSLLEARVKVSGVSGREYIWQNAGDVVEVAPEDVERLLAKRRGGSCCGGKPNPMFEIA
uniref:Uncharacterized protein n=1 Tax=viral metagenome TaxID=1070528 RepID=A0A6H1ZAN3_9ZZZZ